MSGGFAFSLCDSTIVRPSAGAAMNKLETRVDAILAESRGFLKLKPNFVTRYYMDHARLGLGSEPGDTYRAEVNRWVPERWIASTVEAAHSNPAAGEGLSLPAVPGPPLTLRQALTARAPEILGEALTAQYGAEFPVLNKILDPHYPIVFHFHARDEDVWNDPEYFSRHRWGKQEAYYFLPRPKGPVPYTHLGLFPGVTRDDLTRAVARGGEHALELSPVAPQVFEQGMYVPSGVPHRPGTALTLEIQQPSDVSLHLDWEFMGRRKTPEQTHPGFQSMEESLQFVDQERSTAPDIMEANRLIPERIKEADGSGGEQHWIFPPRMTSKFSGKRVRVTEELLLEEPLPYALLVWGGEGELEGRPIAAGDEFLVTQARAAAPHRLRRGGKDRLEAFMLFPPEPLGHAHAETLLRPAAAGTKRTSKGNT